MEKINYDKAIEIIKQLLPDWAAFVAVDPPGRVYYFEHKPVGGPENLFRGYNWWISSCGKEGVVEGAFEYVDRPFWLESLREIKKD